MNCNRWMSLLLTLVHGGCAQLPHSCLTNPCFTHYSHASTILTQTYAYAPKSINSTILSSILRNALRSKWPYLDCYYYYY